MRISPKHFLTAGLLASATLLSGCYEGGYGSVGLNVGAGGPYDYYDGYGAPYGAPYYGYGGGWYNDFYYPGGGVYIYDRYGRRSRWNDGQRSYWNQHRGQGRWEGQAPVQSQRRWFYGGNGRGSRDVIARPTPSQPQGQRGQSVNGNPGGGDRGGWRGNRGGGGGGGGDRPARGPGGHGRDPNAGREQPR